MNSFYTIKKDQTHTYDKNGKRLLITRLISEPLTISQVKSEEKDGYQSYQLAIGSKKRINKPLAGHLKKINIKPLFIREILTKKSEKNIGEQIKVTDIFAIGDSISVKSKTKGRGFAGAMKRWGFAGGPKTHGQSDRQRSPGSIGQGTTPGRVHKGKKMPGRYGGKNLNIGGGKIVYIDETNQEIWITGTVPGPKGGLVEISKKKSGEFVGLFTDPNPVKVEEKVEVVIEETEVKQEKKETEKPEIKEEIKKEEKLEETK